MDISPATLSALYVRYNQLYQESFLKQAVLWNKIATLVTSESLSEQHVWMDRIPQLRIWYDERKIRNAALRTFTATNLPFELTVGVDKFDIQDNKIKAYEPLVRTIGEQAKKWPDVNFFNPVSTDKTVISGALPNGINVVTYDGVAFFSTAHPQNPDDPNSPTQTNYSASGFALTHANFQAVKQTMRGYKGADGLPLKVNPNLLIVPPALEAQAIQILEEEWVSPTASVGAVAAGAPSRNHLVGTADYIVVDDLAGQDSTWYLADVRGSVKPFIWQLREPPVFAMLTKPTDMPVWERHEFQYGVEARGVGTYGPWFFCYRASA
jgi:phage major head subunit gpT-like protein